MNRAKPVKIRRLLFFITFASVMILFLVQGACVAWLLKSNTDKQRQYALGSVNALASSLDLLGRDLGSVGSYISSYSAFRKLYFPGRSAEKNPADDFIEAFHTVRFISSFFPVIKDVVIVGLNGIPFSYFSGIDYDAVTGIQNEYNFTDPQYIERRFFFFTHNKYFAYAVPISGIYATTPEFTKIATCIFLCDPGYIHTIAANSANEAGMRIRIRTADGFDLLPFTGKTGPESYSVSASVPTLGLTVTIFGVPYWNEGAAGVILIFYLISVAVLILTTLILIILMQKNIAAPIFSLMIEMNQLKTTTGKKRLSESPIEEINQVIGGINGMLYSIEQNAEHELESQKQMHELEIVQNETELYALRNQINPHFLYNTLQCIRSLAILDSNKNIADITLAMSNMFRYAMNYTDYVLIKEELENINDFMTITNIRFNKRFLFAFDIDECILNNRMGRMMLQPLVENAVIHGVSKKENGGTITIRGRRENGEIFFSVIDDGPGDGGNFTRILDELQYSVSDNIAHEKKGLFGLNNINRRLKLYYGAQYGLEIRRIEEKTTVSFRFPVE